MVTMVTMVTIADAMVAMADAMVTRVVTNHSYSTGFYQSGGYNHDNVCQGEWLTVTCHHGNHCLSQELTLSMTSQRVMTLPPPPRNLLTSPRVSYNHHQETIFLTLLNRSFQLAASFETSLLRQIFSILNFPFRHSMYPF